ncbi:MAG: ribosome small subunit-dependent GTPase A [Gammaproteobacteria bacterium]|nr:ribosome small subunit-dependent GTPase A [Gammaproteobacteria bacterium]
MKPLSPQEAQVTATFSRRMMLRLENSSTVDARIKGKKLRPVCGDRVEAEAIAGESEWLITAIRPRDNELTRPDNRGRKEVLAANLSCVVVMAATEPEPDWFIVDRYIAAAENMGVKALVVFNKSDLSKDPQPASGPLADYVAAGYVVIRCSAESGQNLELLKEALGGETAIIVGQSGVGKSSVINQIVHDAEQRIGALSSSSREGRHTTVNSIMLDLPGEGRVIDSPGVRDYAPAIDTEEEVICGFREINDAGLDCRFANCRHLREPDCAVKSAVDDGRISARRYESYKRLMVLTRNLAERRR